MVDKILGGLFGGNDEDAKQQRDAAGDFVNRYQQGKPWENISGDEAVTHYKNVVQHLSPEEYEAAASEALSKLSPEQRKQFANFLHQGSDGQVAADTDDPQQLARLTNQARQSDSGLGALFGGGSLDSLLGGGLGGALGGLLGGSGSGSGSGNAGDLLGGLFGGGGSQSKGTAGQGSGGLGDLLENPVVKSVFAGIAAFAAGKLGGAMNTSEPAHHAEKAHTSAAEKPATKRPNLPDMKPM